MAFSLLVENIEERMCMHLDSYCLLIADEQDELEQKLIDDLDYFKQYGTQSGYKQVIVNRIIDSVHFVRSNNNYLMQLTDVLCYIIRRGKESSRKLATEYRLFLANGGKIDYPEWKEMHGNRGQKYFYDTYERIILKKPWLFSKDFPA